jgi:hypothetical protein
MFGCVPGVPEAVAELASGSTTGTRRNGSTVRGVSKTTSPNGSPSVCSRSTSASVQRSTELAVATPVVPQQAARPATVEVGQVIENGVRGEQVGHHLLAPRLEPQLGMQILVELDLERVGSRRRARQPRDAPSSPAAAGVA